MTLPASFNPAMQAALLSATVKFDVLFLVFSSPTPIRVWTGLSNYQLAADDTDTEGGLYLGLGWLQGIPAVSQLINGAAERVEFTLSGVDAAVVALADSEAPGLRNADAFMGLMLWDSLDQPLGAPKWLWEGTSDSPRVASTPSDKDGSPIRQVTLSLGTPMTRRRRPDLAYWTDIQHQVDRPGDTFFSQVPLYNSSTTVRWPA